MGRRRAAWVSFGSIAHSYPTLLRKARADRRAAPVRMEASSRETSGTGLSVLRHDEGRFPAPRPIRSLPLYRGTSLHGSVEPAAAERQHTVTLRGPASADLAPHSSAGRAGANPNCAQADIPEASFDRRADYGGLDQTQWTGQPARGPQAQRPPKGSPRGTDDRVALRTAQRKSSWAVSSLSGRPKKIKNRPARRPPAREGAILYGLEPGPDVLEDRSDGLIAGLGARQGPLPFLGFPF